MLKLNDYFHKLSPQTKDLIISQVKTHEDQIDLIRKLLNQDDISIPYKALFIRIKKNLLYNSDYSEFFDPFLLQRPFQTFN